MPVSGSRSEPWKKLHLFPAMRDHAFFTCGSSSAPVKAHTREQGVLLPVWWERCKAACLQQRIAPAQLAGCMALHSGEQRCSLHPGTSLQLPIAQPGQRETSGPTWCQEGSVNFLPLLPSLTPSMAPGPSASWALITTYPAPFCPRA